MVCTCLVSCWPIGIWSVLPGCKILACYACLLKGKLYWVQWYLLSHKHAYRIASLIDSSHLDRKRFLNWSYRGTPYLWIPYPWFWILGWCSSSVEYPSCHFGITEPFGTQAAEDWIFGIKCFPARATLLCFFYNLKNTLYFILSSWWHFLWKWIHVTVP